MPNNRISHSMEEVERRAEKYSYENLPQGYKKTIKHFLKLVENGKILDIGCGHGRDVNYFSTEGFKAYGIDPSENMIRFATKNMAGEYEQVSFEDFKAKPETFDGIWCNTVMQFFRPENYPQALRKMHEMLKKDGALYITFRLLLPEHDREKYSRKGEEAVRYRISGNEAEKLLENTGFTIIEQNKTETNDPIISFICKKN
jgi:cyclopropane fatty-acyl-phospholipid synthase-like methyltransferase